MNVFIERKARSSCSPLNWNGSSGCPIAIPDRQRCVSKGLTDSGFNKLWFADFPNCTITLRGSSVPALEMKLVKKKKNLVEKMKELCKNFLRQL